MDDNEDHHQSLAAAAATNTAATSISSTPSEGVNDSSKLPPPSSSSPLHTNYGAMHQRLPPVNNHKRHQIHNASDAANRDDDEFLSNTAASVVTAASAATNGPLQATLEVDDTQVLLVSEPSPPAIPMVESLDQILNSYGPCNPFIVMIFALMAFCWTLAALPMLASAWLVGTTCDANATICTPTPGTVTEEFELIGDRARWADITTMAFMLGNAMGSSAVSRFSDIKGRRLTIVVSLVFYGSLGCFATLSRNVYTLTVLRLLQGVFYPGAGLINFVHAYESSPMSLRKYSTMFFGLMWVVGYVMIAPLSYVFPHWRTLLIAASLPSLLTAVLLYFVLPESFHYAVMKGDEEGTKRWLDTANRWSKNPRRDLSADVIIRAHHKPQYVSGSSSQSRGIIGELLKQRRLLLFTCVLAYLWTVDSFVYYGLSLFSTVLAGDKYLNYALSGIVEIPSYMVSPLLLDLLGRRVFVSSCHFLTAFAFVCTIFVQNPTISLIIWLIGKFAISCAFTSLFVYGSEVFPTVLRSGCIGICVVLSRVGSVFAPMTRSMALVSPILPNVFFFVTAGLAGAATLVLPETKNCELSDELPETHEVRDD